MTFAICYFNFVGVSTGSYILVCYVTLPSEIIVSILWKRITNRIAFPEKLRYEEGGRRIDGSTSSILLGLCLYVCVYTQLHYNRYSIVTCGLCMYNMQSIFAAVHPSGPVESRTCRQVTGKDTATPSYHWSKYPGTVFEWLG